MNRARADDPGGETFRPREQVFTQTILAAAALLVPIFAVLYWLTIPSGTWMIIVIAKVLVVGLLVLFGSIFYRTSITVSAAGVRESGLGGLRRYIPRDEVEYVLFVSFYRGHTLDTENQLFIVGHDGNTLVRMRGRYWTAADMRKVLDILGAPATIIDEPQPINEFMRENAALLYWHERRAGFARR
ncbi:hypothetical protein EV379_2698 [Microterricola gilva]|uniref:PH (Pleckstrin Homology) domain-containing protein n=1 Tax=Microterricola gilva TaxID=393267 RepID=A0A4Q8ANU9_9MICO|nr:hypothetical protein [Microterricola gilva]RZU66342.1 hypothetical protein EV379_2698 [Microterricola gilva]